MATDKKEPLYEVIGGWIMLIGVGISVLGFIVTVFIGLGHLFAHVVGYMDYAAMQAALRDTEKQYTWILGSLMMTWWPALMVWGIIRGIGNRITRASSS
jgi:hypothetical protein